MAATFENSVSAWLKLLILPKCVLPSGKCGGRHTKPVPIASLCAMWTDGKSSDLRCMAVSRSSCKKQPSLPTVTQLRTR